MKKLNQYIGLSFLQVFSVALVVVTFVMSCGIIFRVLDLLARGAPIGPVIEMFLWGVPTALTFSIPISALTTSLLVFGRLSADGEISAMKACGVGLWQILAPPLWISAGLMLVCLYINDEISPRGHLTSRQLLYTLGAKSPLQLLDEGRFNQDFNGLTIFFGKKKGDQVSNVRIYDFRIPKTKKEILAKSGVIRVDEATGDILIELSSATIDPILNDKPGVGFAERMTFRIEKPGGTREYKKRQDDLTFAELWQGMRDVSLFFPKLSRADRERQRMALVVELNKRLVLSLACFSFVLLGVPLGITAHRRESSVGMGISLVLVFLFYLFVIVAESLAAHPGVWPDVIIWMPVLISVGLGSYLVERGT